MGGKTGTSTASTSIPPEVLARYNAVNKTAQDTAAQPFQQYSSDASAFVAPLNEQQQAATAQTNRYANAAQPSIEYAQQGYTPEGYQKGVQGYMNPFLSNAMGATAAQMNNVNQQEQQKMIGSSIGAGAFGGDRANIGLGNLENQQNLAMGQTLGNMASQGYQNAAQNYMTGLGQIGNLGIQGQQAGLQGAQAMMGAGTLGQQTTQAGKTALYNQFQQQQAYPFQVAQFLANIAEGTGALSGSTTTQTSPQSFFGSDERIKHDIKRVGTANNGLPIYTFKYKGDQAEQTHIGYMAQDVEKVHPEAVAKDQHGIRYVNYDKASEPAHKAFGGANFNPAANLMTGGSDQTSQDPEWLKNHPNAEGHGGENRGIAGFEANHSYSPDTGYGGGIAGMGGNLGSAIGKVGGEVTGDSGVGGTEGQAMYAHGGVIPNHEGGAVMPHHMGQGFAVGGDVISPTDMAALIAQQQQSFSPHGEAGMYGASSQMTPGGKSFVPAANMHVAKLQAPQISGSTQGDTLMGDIEGVSNIGDKLTKMQGYAAKAIGQPAKVARDATATDPAQAAQPATGMQGVADWAKQFFPQGQAHGGKVGYATGGSPYATDDPLSQVVSDTEKDKERQLMKSPIANPKGNGTFGDLMSLAQLPSEIAGIGSAASSIGSGIGSAMLALAPIGLAKGGVVGYAEGGDTAPEDDIMGKYAPAIAGIESSGRYGALGPVTKTGDRAYGKYQVMGANVPSWTEEALGKRLSTDEFLANPEAQDATFKHHFGKALSQYGNPQDAASVWFSGKPTATAGNAADVTGTTVPAYLKKFNQQIGEADLPAKDAVPAQAVVNGQQGFQAPDGEPQKPSPFKGIGDALTNENYIVPLLSGLGAMAGSKSRYLGSAILEGIGAGAGAYENVQNNIAQRGLTNAQRDVQSTLAAGNAQTVAQNAFFKGPDGQTYAMTPQGPMLQGLWTQALAQGKYIPTVAYDQMVQMIAKIPGAQPLAQSGAAQPTDPSAPRSTQAVPGMPTGNEPLPPPNPYTGVGHAGNSTFDSTYQQSFLDQPTFQTKKAISDQAEVAALAASRAAQAQGGTLNQLASTILKTNPNSWNAIGVNNEYTNNVSNYWNDLVSRLGGSMGASADQLRGWKLNPEDVGSKQAADKISGMLQFAQLNSNDTHSLGALQTAGRVIPSTANSYEGAVDILSGLYADKQKAIDQNNYVNEYKKLAIQKGGPVFANRYLVQDALQAFAQDHSDNQYGTEKERLKKILAARTPDGGSLWDKLYSGGKPDTTLDQKLPGMGRYIRNN